MDDQEKLALELKIQELQFQLSQAKADLNHFEKIRDIERLANNDLKLMLNQFSWVSVKERLPEDEQKILYTDGEEVYSGKYDANSRRSFDLIGAGGWEWEEMYEPEEITHWMPVPELPKKEGV